MLKNVSSSLRTKTIIPLVTTIVLLTLIACSSRPSETRSLLPAAPPVPAGPSASFNQLTEQQRVSLQEFARSLATLERDWDSFHTSYDSWFRSRNIPLELDMEKSLGQLLDRFQTVKGLIVNLSTITLTKSIADQLFEAAQDEEKALRALKDAWRPGDVAAFQRYEESRLKVEKVQQNIRKQFAEVMAATEPQNKESLEKFYKPYREVETSLDKFGQDYDRWKATGMEKDPPAKALPNFVTSYRGILANIYGLPRTLIGQEFYDLLASAGEKEEAALIKLNETFRPRSEEVFASYEQERGNVRKMRRQAAAGLELLRSAGMEANRASLSAFSASLQDIHKRWDEFYRGYDSWRNPAGDTNRDAIAKELMDFNGKFNAIVVQARSLPQNALVRPLSEMVIIAVEKEQQGLLRLQEGWRLYDPAAWRSFGQEQQVAEKARRQIRGAFTDLLAKYNLSLADMRQ